MLNIQTLRHSVKRTLIKAGFYRYPNFLVLGAQKAGTTFLYSVLRQHRQIVEPVHKEAHFFDYDDNYNGGSFYYKLNFDLSFRFKSGQLTFEATPDYLAHKESAERIFNLLPNAKFIILLREPIERAYSAWKMHHYRFEEDKNHAWLYDPRSFEEVITDALEGMDKWHLMNHIGRGLYGMQIQQFLKYYKRDDFLFLYSMDLKTNTQVELNKITSFLGIEKMSIENIDTKDHRFWRNKSDVYNKLSLREDLLVQLHDYYEEDRLLLQSLLNNKLPW